MDASWMALPLGTRTRFQVVVLTLALWLPALSAVAQTPAPSPSQPESVQQFIELIANPDVQKWLLEQADPVQAGEQPAAPHTEPDISFADFTTRLRTHMAGLFDASRSFPSQTMQAADLLDREISESRGIRPMFLVAAFLAVGLLTQWLFRRSTAGWRAWMAQAPFSTVHERTLAVGTRLLWAACYLASFAIGSIGFFLLFEWPPLIREIVVGYLLAIVVFRLASALVTVLLAPPGSTDPTLHIHRVIPVSDAAAAHWAKRAVYLIGWYAFGWVTIRLLGTMGFSIPARQLVAYSLGLVLLAIGIEAVWRRPHAHTPTEQKPRISWRAKNTLWTLYFVAIWILWVAGAMKLFWLAVVVAALPGSVILAKASVNNMLGARDAYGDDGSTTTVLSVIVERGIRAGLIIGSIVFLADVLGVELTEMTMQDSPTLRLIRGILSAGIIVLAVDLIWNVTKVLIDRKLGQTQVMFEIGSEQERRRARIRTLLPILKNVLMILLVAIALMMGLSSLGVEIGPLIAGAGVVGVAIGFGAQTVVKDVISGMFYLLDDAFRVGEYIQSGSYKGTVESFSLRSIKLRHHRGPIFIVPFSELGAVQNMSRDWSVVKFMLTVSFDADIAKVKSITKTVGKTLKDDEEFQPFIIENLKMKGVEEFTDYGIKLSFGMTLKPTQLQSAIRRRAYAMLREAFKQNGIEFAQPTVQIGGDDKNPAAAAAQIQLQAQQREAALGAMAK